MNWCSKANAELYSALAVNQFATLLCSPWRIGYTHNLSSIARYMRDTFGEGEWNENLTYHEDARIWSFATTAPHWVCRLSHISPEARAVANRLVVAVAGPPDPFPLHEYVTATVCQLVRPSLQPVPMTIVADAFQDAGLPEDHWLLERLRDETTPFVRSEWFHRFVLGSPHRVRRATRS